jgi:hypothetical protein
MKKVSTAAAKQSRNFSQYAIPHPDAVRHVVVSVDVSDEDWEAYPWLPGRGAGPAKLRLPHPARCSQGGHGPLAPCTFDLRAWR